MACCEKAAKILPPGGIKGQAMPGQNRDTGMGVAVFGSARIPNSAKAASNLYPIDSYDNMFLALTEIFSLSKKRWEGRTHYHVQSEHTDKNVLGLVRVP